MLEWERRKLLWPHALSFLVLIERETNPRQSFHAPKLPLSHTHPASRPGFCLKSHLLWFPDSSGSTVSSACPPLSLHLSLFCSVGWRRLRCGNPLPGIGTVHRTVLHTPRHSFPQAFAYNLKHQNNGQTFCAENFQYRKD